MLKNLVVALIAVASSCFCLGADTYEQAKEQAEQLYSQKSYALAYKAYFDIHNAQPPLVPDSEKRWVAFRLADTLWRSEASTQTADSSKLQKAIIEFQKILNDAKRKKDRDLVWVEIQESFGDFYSTHGRGKSWHQAWIHYQLALDYWASSRDLDTARVRYIQLIYKATSDEQSRYRYEQLPLEFAENFKKIAQTDQDKAYASFLLALALRGNDNERAMEEFQNAINFGKESKTYDDALFEYAQLLLQGGKITEGENGEILVEPDYPKALEIFRRLTQEFQKGQTRYWEQAAEQIKQITAPQLNVSVSNIFLPNSEIRYSLNGQNLKTIEFNLWQVELPRDLHLGGENIYEWVKSVDLKSAKNIKTWTWNSKNQNDYKPFSSQETLEKLSVGAYILEAKSENLRSQDLVLVTDATLVMKTSSRQALLYFCDAMSGKPIPKATLKLYEGNYSKEPQNGEGKMTWKEFSAQTDDDGIAILKLSQKEQPATLFAVAQNGPQQAFNLTHAAPCFAQPSSWRIYVETDRPAYRPKENVQWKITARTYDGQNYSTPAGQKISYKISDPQGQEIHRGEIALNAFGSFWDSFELTENMMLGEYQITFSSKADEYFGSKIFFRLEEYKLPEFKVSVQTPQKDGKKITFRLGEKIKADIQADYYFGGAVSNAQVEVIVYQKPSFSYWQPKREFPWFYQDMQGRPPYWGAPEQIIKREKLKTNSEGKAQITFETPRDYNQDFEYRIEARVTDSSRREIVGSDTIKVGRQRYSVHAEPEGYLHSPSDKVTIKFNAADANDQPQQVEGDVKITREYWYEIWISPEGKEVKGDDLKHHLPNYDEIFLMGHPFPSPGWKLKFRGYEHEEILTQKVKTNAEGEGELTFTPGKEGYYRIAWKSPDHGGRDVKTDAFVWAATHQTTELGYRSGGVEIIADKDTFQAGQKAPVMISTHASDRYVLFCVEADDLLSYQLLHIEGTAKLVQLDIKEKHTPNIFLKAEMVSAYQIFSDAKQIVIPPKKNFLNLSAKTEKDEFLPGESNEFTLSVTDSENNPVASELSFGVVDESVFYIQKDYAEDPRQFFFGDKKENFVQTSSTFQQRPYLRLPLQEETQPLPPHIPRPFFARDTMEMDGGKMMSSPAAPAIAMARNESFASGGAAMPPAMMQKSVRTLSYHSNDSASPEMAQASPVAAEPPSHQVKVRSDFRSTVFWQPDIKTDANGQAKVKMTYPDSTTSWKATARAVTAANQFGVADVKTRTQKPLIARIQAPRFLVVGDDVTLSGVFNNNTDKSMSVIPMIEIFDVDKNGETLGENKNSHPSIEIQPHGEARVDWQIKIERQGHIKLRLVAKSADVSDAMEMSYPVYEHGIDKLIAKSGKTREEETSIILNLPKERKSAALNIQLSPSLAVTMLDSLPFLIDYPYGCVEQTMSRFLPAVIVSKTLQDLGLSPQDISGKIFGGLEKDHTTKTQPQGAKDLSQLQSITSQSLEKIYDAQQKDGGWGWWKTNNSDEFMTAYVLWGLSLAQKSGIEVTTDSLHRAREFLGNSLVKAEQDYDRQAWMLHALASSAQPDSSMRISQAEQKAIENIWENREKLNAYTRALYALALHDYGEKERAQTVIQNLVNGVKIDDTPDQSLLIGGQSTSKNVMKTAHWGEDGIYHRWSEGGVEATAFALRALLAVDPKNELVEPVLNWLIKNRRGAQWNNTRDTAIVILALNDYLKISGELQTHLEYELLVNGQQAATQKITPQDILKAPSHFEINPSWIQDGDNTITIKKKGEGNLYFSAYAKFFSLEKPIKPAGNEIFVKREYFKKKAYPTLLKGFVYENQPVQDGDELQSGDRIEVLLTIESKNNYEYLVFEDLKPSGLEAVQLQSGKNTFAKELKSSAVPQNISEPQDDSQNDEGSPIPLKARMMKGILPPPSPDDNPASDFTGRRRIVHQELRDRKVAFFLDKLPQGVWQIRYELRAEIPGKFSALPTLGQAMYVPEIRCNAEEISISVKE